MVRFDEIREVLLNVPEPLDACKVLTDKANQAGGHDNITVIVARFDGPGIASMAPSDEELVYRKYPLPEPPFTRAPESASRPSRPAETHAPIALVGPPSSPHLPPSERLSDHGPSKSKVAHTMIGAQMNQAALSALAAASTAEPPPHAPTSSAGGAPDSVRRRAAADNEPIFIPTSNAPAWMVGGVVLTALALALVAGYYLLR
jgi:protein phosphatase